MEMIDRAFSRALTLNAVMCALMIVATILCVLASRKKDSMAIFAVAIGTFLIIYCIGAAPLVKDCLTNDVVRVEATYINTLAEQSKATSSVLGEHAVILKTDEGELALTTVPFSDDIFPVGEYSVTAWYTRNSKMLLYMEIHGIEG